MEVMIPIMAHGVQWTIGNNSITNNIYLSVSELQHSL